MHTTQHAKDAVEKCSSTIRRLEMITESHDIVLAKNLALAELCSLVKQKDFVQVLALEPTFIKFLRRCFDMFHEEAEKLESCVDTLLLAGFSVSQLGEFGFGEVLNMLSTIERYRSLVENLRGVTGVFVSKKKRTPRRVSFQEEKNEVRYYVKEEDTLLKHGGYGNNDINEALVLRSLRRQAEVRDIDWFRPEKLKLSEEEPRVKSLYRASEALRESTSFEITNTDSSIDFFPSEAYISLEDNKSRWLPLINYGERNVLPCIETVKDPAAALEISVSTILKDPAKIHKMQNVGMRS